MIAVDVDVDVDIIICKLVHRDMSPSLLPHTLTQPFNLSSKVKSKRRKT